MPFLADPVFFSSVKRNSGSKRRLIHISSSEERDVEVRVKEMEKPEWIEIEGVFPGQPLRFEEGKATPFIVNLNTTHKFFPKHPVKDERIRILFENGECLEVQVSVPEIVDVVEPYRGVFAIDFGTTNSCYAFRGGTARASKNLQQAKVSGEIPSVIYFHDVADPVRPRYSIGGEALFDVLENSSRTYAYCISLKRMLGQNRTLTMLDKLGGTQPGHRQEWHVEEIASFVIRELMERADEDLGQRVQEIVATFPPMFSRDRKEAIRRAMAKALEARGVQAGEKSIVMDLDEANAAAFHYVYTALMEEFRKFNVTEKKFDLLAYDFGGGTIDIALVGGRIHRAAEGRIRIETELKGLSGEEMYGGDNVTLELFRLAKWRIAAATAERHVKEAEERRKAAEQKRAVADDIWGPPSAKGVSPAEEMFSREPEKKREVAPAPETDPDLALIVNRENPALREAALTLIAKEKPILEESISTGRSIREIVAAKERVKGLAEKRAQQIEAAVETIVPTKFAKYQDVDPHKEDLARKLFHELWYEADALKIRLSQAEGQPRAVAGVLRKIARYAGVDPLLYNEIQFTMDELEKRIDGRVTESVRKAHALWRGAQGGSVGGITVGQRSDANLRVLLYGNSSNLPIVRRRFREVFGLPDENLVLNPTEIKTAVASGACDEYALRREFGEAGLLQYKPVGFLDRLPFSIGLYHRDLSLIGCENGFWPVFPRGTAVGESRDLDEKSNFLIHPELREIPVYVDYHDGSPPRNVGFIDFAKPSDAPTDPSVFEEGPGSSDAKFRIRVKLLPSRELLAKNLQTGQVFGMVSEKTVWATEENPLSGMH